MGITLEEERYKEIMINGESALLLTEEQDYSQERVELERTKPE